MSPELKVKYYKFLQQGYRAKRRGIDFLFSFEEWVEWWGDDFDKRDGHKPEGLVMARNGDIGPYHPSNVQKKTQRENSREAAVRPRRRTPEHTKAVADAQKGKKRGPYKKRNVETIVSSS